MVRLHISCFVCMMRAGKRVQPCTRLDVYKRQLQQEIEEEQAMLQEEAADPLFTDMVQQELRKNRLSLSALDEKLRLL